MLCSNFVIFGRREMGEIVRCLPDKNKISPGSPAVTTVQIEPKICQGQPPTVYSECSRFHPNRFTFGGIIIVYNKMILKSYTKYKYDINRKNITHQRDTDGVNSISNISLR